jgi:hypothetical protein
MKKSFKGYCFDKEKGKYKVRVNVNGKRIHIGYFKTITESEIFYKLGLKLYNGKEFSWCQDSVWEHYTGLKSKDYLDYKLECKQYIEERNSAIEKALKKLGYISK